MSETLFASVLAVSPHLTQFWPAEFSFASIFVVTILIHLNVGYQSLHSPQFWLSESILPAARVSTTNLCCFVLLGLIFPVPGLLSVVCKMIKTKTKKPLFYLDNIFNNLLIFNTVQTKKPTKKLKNNNTELSTCEWCSDTISSVNIIRPKLQ